MQPQRVEQVLEKIGGREIVHRFSRGDDFETAMPQEFMRRVAVEKLRMLQAIGQPAPAQQAGEA